MSRSSPLRALARVLLPVRTRRFLQRVANQAPRRALDLPRDAVCMAFPRAFGGPIPPPGLRSRVGSLSRGEFASVGREGSRAILEAFRKTRRPGRAYPVWLDLGCGCGRIARHLENASEIQVLTGLDVDAAQIAWAAGALPGRFATMRHDPPLGLDAESFDVVYAISIFTHYTEEEQFRWLDELSRILKPEGLLIATTISPWQAGGFSGLSGKDFARLSERGFLCVNAESAEFNERAAFHAPEYLASRWGRRFTPRLYEAYGFVRYQDLSVWERPRAGGPP